MKPLLPININYLGHEAATSYKHSTTWVMKQLLPININYLGHEAITSYKH